MLAILQVATTLLVAIAMAMSLAHALELPGKLRLTKEQYEVVQPIYFPGFTFAGISEPLSVLCLASLAAFTPQETARFWLGIGALAAMICVNIIFWFMTQPVNKLWMGNAALKGASKSFFETGPPIAMTANWKAARNRWEQSHLLRAVCAFGAFAALVVMPYI